MSVKVRIVVFYVYFLLYHQIYAFIKPKISYQVNVNVNHYHSTFPKYFPSFKPKKNIPSIISTHSISSSTKLYSFGDPDRGLKWTFLRSWQQFARLYDHLIFPNDPDIPGMVFITSMICLILLEQNISYDSYEGLTFPTPIEWAPWMETIWFGNYYDYRAAFFHDVMYSNNVPGREGILY
jgi:hypothetical protein